jgi:biopolymer transport protein ExbD
MKPILVVCLVAVAFTINPGPSVVSQSATTTQASSFAGTWKERVNDLPGIDLIIEQADGRITGNAVFYFQERKDVNSPWHVAGQYTVTLQAVHVTGKTLTFEVEHHACHGCAEFGPNVAFRMELAGPDQARLWRIGEDGKDSPQMNLVRDNPASPQAAPVLQPGISVEMPVTRSAKPRPDADQEDAVIVTVTADGRVFVGVNAIDLNNLAGELEKKLAGRTVRTLFIKADARTPYGSVVRVLDAAGMVGVDAPILLTDQASASAPGSFAFPQGLRAVLGHLALRRGEL